MRDTFRAFVEHGVAFTIATDGPEMMRTHLRDELELLLRIGALDEDELAQANGAGTRRASCTARAVSPRGCSSLEIRLSVNGQAGAGPVSFAAMHERTRETSLPKITERQRQVVELIAAGCSNEEVGERLGISPRTAKAHSDVLRQKLGVPRRRQIPAAYRAMTGDDPLSHEASARLRPIAGADGTVPAALWGRRHGSARVSDSNSSSLDAKVNAGGCVPREGAVREGNTSGTVDGGASAHR